MKWPPAVLFSDPGRSVTDCDAHRLVQIESFVVVGHLIIRATTILYSFKNPYRSCLIKPTKSRQMFCVNYLYPFLPHDHNFLAVFSLIDEFLKELKFLE